MARLKNLAGSVLLGLVAYLGIELCALALYFVVFGEGFSFERIQNLQYVLFEESAPVAVEEIMTGRESVIHPYVGYVYDPTAWKSKHAGVPISDWGFIDDKSPIQKRSSDRFVIGIFGGSVAWWFQQLGRASFEEELKRVPSLAHKEFVYVRAALGGYKQPQQLMTLSYLLSQGAEFDLILNLDGFNEIALPLHSNLPNAVTPLFPNGWQMRLDQIPDRKIQVMVGEIAFMEKLQLKAAKLFHRVRFSISAGTFWRLLDKLIISRTVKLRYSLDTKRSSPEELPYAITGPRQSWGKGEELYARLSELWAQSSLQMSRLAQLNGAVYLHFLQPNQYVPGSKQLNDEELETAFDEDYPMARFIAEGYSHLQEQGDRLRQNGLNYFDLSMVFKEVRETAYNDQCCHLSELGNAILGATIGRETRSVLLSAK